MRRVMGLVAALLLTSWLTPAVPAFAAVKVAVIEVKGMVCNA